MQAAIIVLFVFGTLILVHEAGHLIAAKKSGITVEAFSIGMGKRLFGIKIGETDYRVSLFPFGGYCKMAGEDPQEASGKEGEFSSKPVGYRFWVISAGALMNYFFAFIIFSVVFMIGSPTLSNKIGSILEGYPAEKAGLIKGDEIVSINNMDIEYWEDLLLAIKKESKKGIDLIIKVKRDSSVSTINIMPEISENINIFGQKISRPMLGIAPVNEVLSVSYDPLRAFYKGGKQLLGLSAMTYKMLWLIITGGAPAKNTLSGPIGIVYFIKEASTLGIVPLMMITANISMALAIFNLLPIPVLDGGHLLFLVFEKIRGKALSVKVQTVVTQIALVLLVSFAIFVSWQDTLRFTPVGKLLNSNERVANGEKAK